MNILALDSATPACSVAVLSGGNVLAECFSAGQKNHTEKLLKLVDAALSQADAAGEDIDLVAVSVGPGTFTGLRSGISTAQGLAFAWEKPLAGVSSLEILAFQAGPFPGLICPMIDARKQQVYTCRYRMGSNGIPEKCSDERAVAPEQYLAEIQEPAVFIGNGALCYRGLIEDVLGDSARVMPDVLSLPRASTVGCIADRSYSGGTPPGTFQVQPAYIRPPDAKVGKGRKGM